MRSNQEKITGHDLRRVREQLGLDPFAFARLLGVHVSTIYRWENMGRQVVRMDPLQRELLSRLVARLKHTAAEQQSQLGKALIAGLIAGGVVAGLLVLLRFLEDKGPAR